MAERPVAVLIVDEDHDARTRMVRALLRAGFQVRECAEGEEALAAAGFERPAAVVLEVDLPDVDGFEVCRELRDRFGDDLPVVLVSGRRVTTHDRIAGLLIGADDYLVKPVNADELLVRLRRLLTRSAGSPGGTSDAAVRDGLSPRELEILRLLARGLSAAAIAERLVISRKTVSTHLQHVMAKLGVHSRAQAVAEAYRLGLVGDRAAEPGSPLSAVP
jgi:DNA-binding NarL/FixJ family response regulator